MHVRWEERKKTGKNKSNRKTTGSETKTGFFTVLSESFQILSVEDDMTQNYDNLVYSSLDKKCRRVLFLLTFSTLVCTGGEKEGRGERKEGFPLKIGKNRELFSLNIFFFPFQTTWCPHGNLSFVFFISYAYICTCIRLFKETIPSSSITWSEMAKQNIQAKEVQLKKLIDFCMGQNKQTKGRNNRKLLLWKLVDFYPPVVVKIDTTDCIAEPCPRLPPFRHTIFVYCRRFNDCGINMKFSCV